MSTTEDQTVAALVCSPALPTLTSQVTIYGWSTRSAGCHGPAHRQVIRRYKRERPGELVHIDVKKLGRIPDGGGHQLMAAAGTARGRGIGTLLLTG
jgi:hypothetical protein